MKRTSMWYRQAAALVLHTFPTGWHDKADVVALLGLPPKHPDNRHVYRYIKVALRQLCKERGKMFVVDGNGEFRCDGEFIDVHDQMALRGMCVDTEFTDVERRALVLARSPEERVVVEEYAKLLRRAARAAQRVEEADEPSAPLPASADAEAA